MKISIPKPCHENWDAMLPEEQGRFCLKCTKTVVDFSARSMEEIKDFFREASGKVCGRFSAEQLHHEPQPVLMPVAKARIGRFAWALYLVFGSLLFSCADQSHTTGEVKEIHVKGHVEKQQSPAAEIKTQDSLTPKQRKEIKAQQACAPQNTKIAEPVEMIKGEAIVEPIIGDVILEE